MPETFTIAARETLEFVFLLALFLSYPLVRQSAVCRGGLLAGALWALTTGLAVGYYPELIGQALSSEGSTFWRHAAELVVFYLAMVFASGRPEPPPWLAALGLFALGIPMVFFEARGVAFVIHDIGLMGEDVSGAIKMGLLGAAVGLSCLVLLRLAMKRAGVGQVLTLPGLLVFAGAFKFAFGGVRELGERTVLTALQDGFEAFLSGAVGYVQGMFIVVDSQLIKAPFAGLAGFLSGDRTAMALMVAALTGPPLYVLMDIFSRPDPLVGHIRVAAERRLKIAFFRKDLVLKAVAPLTAFVLIVVLLHAINISLNPLYDPTAMPVQQAEDSDGYLLISVKDNRVDFSDGKLRKYVYYHEERQIIFLAMEKPDGSLGVALDECEICKPAAWNKNAQGYAQKGENLICKYCMTPITLSSLNNHGGCNPIPVPHSREGDYLKISVKDLVRVFDETKALQKKGTHL